MPAGAHTGDAGVGIDARDLLRTAKALKSLDDRAFIRQLRRDLRTAAGPVLARAKANAGQVSAAVARSIVIETAFTTKRTGVFVVAKRSRMPAGHESLPGLLERGQGGRGGSFRHPVFGRDVYVTQPTHPFLAPALDGQRALIEAQIRAGVIALLRAADLTTT